MRENKPPLKNTFRAYTMALVGMLLGVVGMHRFYLDFHLTGGCMMLLFFAGLGALALGYAQLLNPFIAQLVAVSGDLSQIDRSNLLDHPRAEGWFYCGMLMSAASLCWLFVDILTMPQLVRKANKNLL